MPNVKQRRVSWFHRRMANPLMRHLAGHLRGHALLETTGRHTGLARRTPVGGMIEASSFWLVSDHGRASNYVRNIEADPRVRVQIRGLWRSGTALLLDDDDPTQRLRTMPKLNSALVRALGTDLLTVRVDLDK